MEGGEGGEVEEERLKKMGEEREEGGKNEIYSRLTWHIKLATVELYISRNFR